MIKPAMVVGLGQTASQALDEIALYARQAYGGTLANELALIAFCAPPDTISRANRAWVKVAPAFENDLVAWLEDGNISSTLPSITGWFDQDYYSRHDRLPHLDLSTDRQVVRARFLTYLTKQGGKLDEFLTEQAKRISATIQDRDNETLHVYLLVDLDDPSSALTLDIANALTRTFRRLNTTIRLLLHVALPTCWGHDLTATLSTTTNRYQLSESFAFFREVERFVTTYGDTQHTVYPSGSGLEGYNAGVSDMIDSIKVYHPARSPSDLTVAWTDVILPQLERPNQRLSSTAGFGSEYELHNIINWKNYELARIANTGKGDTLHVSAYQTRTALFPLGLLRRYWSVRVGKEAFETWLGSVPTRPLEQIKTEIIDGRWQQDNGTILFCPHLLDKLLFGESVSQKLTTLDGIQTILYQTDHLSYKDPAITAIVEENWTSLNWKPDSATIQSYGLTQFHARTLQEMEQQLAGYAVTLRDLGQHQAEVFETILFMVINEHLSTENQDIHSAGVRTIHALLHEIKVRLTHWGDQIKAQVRRQNQAEQLTAEQSTNLLELAAGRVIRFRWAVLGETREFNIYLENVNKVLQEQRLGIAIRSLSECVQAMLGSVTHVYEGLEHWASTLWDGEESLAGRLKISAQKPFTLPDHPDRLWLYTQEWGDAYYKTAVNPLKKDLYRSLIWSFIPENKGWTLVFDQKPDEAPPVKVVSKAVTTTTMNKVSHRLVIPGGRTAIYFDVWVDIVEKVVERVTPDMWRDYLFPNDNYTHLFPDIKRLLTRSKVNWVPNPYITNEDVIVTKTLGTSYDLLIAPIHEELNRENVTVRKFHDSEDTTRIVRYTSFEVFALDELPAYQAALQAYQNLNKNERARLHILPAESTMVYWETEAYHLTGKTVFFPSRIVALLGHFADVKQFVQLEALGLVSPQAYGEVRRYSLRLPPNQVLWLTSPGSASRLDALTAFVFQRHKFQSGELPHLGEMTRPTYEVLEDVLRVQVQGRHADTPLQELPYYEDVLALLNMLSPSDRQTWNYALQQAEIANNLWQYYRQFDAESNRGVVDIEEQQLEILLMLMAKELYVEALSSIREMIY